MERPTALRLFLCGDVMTGRGVDQILPCPSAPQLFEPYVHDAREYVALAEQANGPIPRPAGYAYPWGDTLEELERWAPAARIVNLETSITTHDEPFPDKGIHYRMHPRNVPCLTAARIDVCVLANNHVLDWGREGLIETLDVLHAAGIRTCGAGRTAAEAEHVTVVETAAGRALVAAWAHPSSGVPPSWRAEPSAPGVAFAGELTTELARVIGARLEEVAQVGDLRVVSIHWGSNWGYEVPESHVRFARALVDAGVDVVHGHSSHHPRPLEIYDGKPIFYGAGDLLSDYEGIAGHESFRGELVLLHLPAFDAGRLVDLRLIPMRLRNMTLTRASAADARWLAGTLTHASRPFGTRVRVDADGSLTVTRAAAKAALA